MTHNAPVQPLVPLFPALAFVDIETTGGHGERDRVTEVAVITLDEDGTEQRWAQLVNPGVAIPAFIQSLTGINDAMVRDAPPFAAIAEDLLARLHGRVFVAHNARFDYGFLRAEFRRCGLDFAARVLCTVKLSRRLYPAQARHNLDAVVAAHGLHVTSRHRAMGDADVLHQFWNHLQREHEPEELLAVLRELTRTPALPPHLDMALIERIPERPGVYVFLDEQRQPLYVGKSKSLRTRVLAHFTAALRSTREMRLAMQVRDIEWTETAGELGALLLESAQVKARLPYLNIRLRRNGELWSWFLPEAAGDDAALQSPELVHGDEVPWGRAVGLYGVFRSRAKARSLLESLADQHRLCRAILGLEARVPGKACFGYQVRTCSGACVGAISAAQHNLTLRTALAAHQVQMWPFDGPVGIREGQVLHVVDHWRHLGSVHDGAELDDLLRTRQAAPAFDADVYALLQAALRRARPGQVVQLKSLR